MGRDVAFSIEGIRWNEESAGEKARQNGVSLKDVLDALPRTCVLRLNNVDGLDDMDDISLNELVHDALLNVHEVMPDDFDWSFIE